MRLGVKKKEDRGPGSHERRVVAIRLLLLLRHYSLSLSLSQSRQSQSHSLALRPCDHSRLRLW